MRTFKHEAVENIPEVVTEIFTGFGKSISCKVGTDLHYDMHPEREGATYFSIEALPDEDGESSKFCVVADGVPFIDAKKVELIFTGRNGVNYLAKAFNFASKYLENRISQVMPHRIEDNYIKQAKKMLKKHTELCEIVWDLCYLMEKTDVDCNALLDAIWDCIHIVEDNFSSTEKYVDFCWKHGGFWSDGSPIGDD